MYYNIFPLLSGISIYRNARKKFQLGRGQLGSYFLWAGACTFYVNCVHCVSYFFAFIALRALCALRWMKTRFRPKPAGPSRF